MKDAGGHGSNNRGGTGAQGMRLVRTHTNGPHSAKVYKNPEWEENVVKFFHNGQYQSKADYHTDDMSDAHATARNQLQRYVDQDAKNGLAGGGQKSANIPTHSGMSARVSDPSQTPQTDAAIGRLSDALDRAGVPRQSDNIQRAASDRGYQHAYNPAAVNKAIDSASRRGPKIGGKERGMIHALLKGRH